MQTEPRTSSWPYEPTEGTKTPEGDQRTTACKLTGERLAARVEDIRRDLVPRITGFEEIQDGCVYWFRRTEENLQKVLDFALYESDCCDVLDFGVGLAAGGDKISLRISGPHGAAGFARIRAAEPDSCC